MIRVLGFSVLLYVAACGGVQWPSLPFDWRAALKSIHSELEESKAYVGDPVYIRIFKEDNILELWMKPQGETQYNLVKTYAICNWSGRLGPKFFEGDHQSPEGFYETNMQSLNPNSQYHLSFNINFPNRFDRVNGRTGSYIMVHGDCVSEGCYAMRNDTIEILYALVQKALENGQGTVPIHVFPFKMEGERLLHEMQSPAFDFWMNIKEGYDYFEEYRIPPKWIVRDKRYEFY